MRKTRYFKSRRRKLQNMQKQQRSYKGHFKIDSDNYTTVHSINQNKTMLEFREDNIENK